MTDGGNARYAASMPPTALGVLLALQLATPDDDLRARFDLAAVPGVEIALVQGEALPPAEICAGAHPTCPDPERRYDIHWGSAPEKVTPLRVADDDQAGARVLLRSDRGDPLLFARDRTLFVAFDPTPAARRWLYFNYLLYAAASDVAGKPPASYADWPNSPMPHGTLRRVAAAVAVVVWIAILAAFRLARRRGRADPEAAVRFFGAVNGVTDDARAGKRKASAWTKIGFARPLAGLLSQLSLMCFVIGPYFAITWLLGSQVQPFPEADGLWRTTWDTLWVVWMIFELATAISFVKFFAQDRVSAPKEALADVQFYVWWQIFSRTAMATGLVLIAIGVVPHSSYAIYAPFVALYASVWLPVMPRLGILVCQALQRFDYQNLLDVAELRLLKFIVPIPFVLLGRSWGASHPVYGEAFGAALGLGLGQLALHVVLVALSVLVLRHLRVPLGPLFLAQFTARTAKRMLAFGAKVTLGTEPTHLVQALESIIIINYLRDFTLWEGIRDLLIFRIHYTVYAWSVTFSGSGVPAISEAFSAGKKTLTQYYVARYLQFGMLFAVIVFSLNVAVGPAFITALGPQWAAAQRYLVIVVVIALLLPPYDVSNALQQGAGRAGTFAVVTVIEQSLRLAYYFVLVPRFQFAGLILGTLLTLVSRSLIAWTVNHRTIVKLRVSIRAVILAPAIAGTVNFAVLKGLTYVWAPSTIPQTLALITVAAPASIFVCFFVYGLAGGCDDAAVEEAREALGMTTVLRPVARAIQGTLALGARLAPFRPRPLPFGQAALAEARELEATEREALARARSGESPPPASPAGAAVASG